MKTWFVIARYNEPDATGETYEEILESCYTLGQAWTMGKEYAPWFDGDWSVLLRSAQALTGKEFLHQGKQNLKH